MLSELNRAFDLHTEKTISIVNHFDLNNNEILKTGQQAEGIKRLCCWPCESEPITGTLSISKCKFKFKSFNFTLKNIDFRL